MLIVQLSGDFVFSDADVMNQDYIKALTTDCWMTISIMDNVLYNDWICPLELYFQYMNWKKEFLAGNVQSFHYISDDNTVNPILSFHLIDDQWAISSCLTDNSFRDKLSTAEVLRFFESFETQLFKHKE